MKILPEVIVHEAGHLVVGHFLGVREDGIIFAGAQANEAAGAWYSKLDTPPLDKIIVRSFAGLLAHVHLMPETLAPQLCSAYRHSIIFTPSHPYYTRIAPKERDFLSGAHKDMEIAWDCARRLCSNESEALASLQSLERKARALVGEHSHIIIHIAEDVKQWSNEPDRKYDGFPIYPYQQRAKVVIEKWSAASQ